MVNADDTGQIREADARFAWLVGQDAAALRGQPVRILIHPDDRAAYDRLLADPGRDDAAEVRLLVPNGEPRAVRVQLAAAPGGGLTHVAVQLAGQLQHDNLRASEARYALAAEGADDGLWDWDMRTGRAYYSPRFCQMLGYEPGRLGDTIDGWFSLIDPRDMPQFEADLSLHTAGQTARLRNEHRVRDAEGRYRWVLCRGLARCDEAGQPLRAAGWVTDIQAQKEQEAELRYAAQHDRLTGLPNREQLMERLRRCVEANVRNPRSSFALLMLDFDRFKLVNDCLGHLAGDQLLIGIAKRFGELLDGAALAARLGGDEFAVLIPRLDKPDAVTALAERLVEGFSKPYYILGHEITSTSSIGVVISQGQYKTPDDILRDADAAMYAAKEAGRSRHVLFDREMHEKAMRRLVLEKYLRHAVERDEMRLHYQPIVCLFSGAVLGLEALLRWQHPQEGLILPGQFVSIAEETGLIVPLGDWVLDESCRQLAAWRDAGVAVDGLTINVNVSKRQLLQPRFPQRVREVLRARGVRPEQIKLEITESIIMNERTPVVPTLREIRDLGVRLAMDDFGTGHSSLSCLHQFPIDTLKIDRAFARNAQNTVEYATVTHAIVTLAHALNMKVVAEGVETLEQLCQLQSLECDHAQGYYFGRPIPADEVPAMLRKPPTLAAQAA